MGTILILAIIFYIMFKLGIGIIKITLCLMGILVFLVLLPVLVLPLLVGTIIILIIFFAIKLIF